MAFCLSNGFIIIFWMAKANRLKVLVYICCGDMSLFPSFLYNDLQFWISLRHHKPSNGFVVIYGRGKPIAKRISAQPLGDALLTRVSYIYSKFWICLRHHGVRPPNDSVKKFCFDGDSQSTKMIRGVAAVSVSLFLRFIQLFVNLDLPLPSQNLAVQRFC